jgi:predicted negative regulator of RcsB-dependent stress response
MAKHPGARRVHKSASDEDAFVAGVLESSVWARTHARHLIIGGVVALLAVVLFVYLRTTRAQTNQQAAVELDQLRGTVQSGNLELARQDVQKFLDSFGRTPSAREARLLLGQLQLQGGEAQNAVATLRPIADDVESSLGYNAALMLAAAYRANKQDADADRTYLRIADRARFDYQKREALDLAAQLRAENGNPTGAIELYERILASFDTDQPMIDPDRNVYEMRLAELRAAAAGPTRS